MVKMDGYPLEVGDKVFSTVDGWGKVKEASQYNVVIDLAEYSEVIYVSEGNMLHSYPRRIFWDVPEVIPPVPDRKTYEYQWVYKRGENNRYGITLYHYATEADALAYLRSYGVAEIYPFKKSRREVLPGSQVLQMDGIPVKIGDNVYDLKLGLCRVSSVDHQIKIEECGTLCRSAWRDVPKGEGFRLLYWAVPEFVAPKKPERKVIYQWFFKNREETLPNLTPAKFETKEAAEEFLYKMGYQNAVVTGPCEETKEIK